MFVHALIIFSLFLVATGGRSPVPCESHDDCIEPFLPPMIIKRASNSVKLHPDLVELKVDIGLTTIVMTSKGVG
ncbi:hypothetical protein P8452_36613 [Trifolium repens]|nr:hypothetical protein P8452_36613 [Trifolium repens]